MTTIPMSKRTKEFFQGVAAGERVNTANEATEFPDFQTRVRTYWFFVGALGAAPESEDGYGLTKFDDFVLGAKLREPVNPDQEQINLFVDLWRQGLATAADTVRALIPLIRRD